MLDFVEETLIGLRPARAVQVAFFVQVPVILSWLMAIASRWNHWLGLLLLNQLNQPIGIITFISNDSVGWFTFH